MAPLLLRIASDTQTPEPTVTIALLSPRTPAPVTLPPMPYTYTPRCGDLDCSREGEPLDSSGQCHGSPLTVTEAPAFAIADLDTPPAMRTPSPAITKVLRVWRDEWEGPTQVDAISPEGVTEARG